MALVFTIIYVNKHRWPIKQSRNHKSLLINTLLFVFASTYEILNQYLSPICSVNHSISRSQIWRKDPSLFSTQSLIWNSSKSLFCPAFIQSVKAFNYCQRILSLNFRSKLGSHHQVIEKKNCSPYLEFFPFLQRSSMSIVHCFSPIIL